MQNIILFVFAFGSAVAAPSETTQHVLDLTGIKQKQIYILKLLNHVLEPVMYKDIEDIGKNYRIEEHVTSYTKPEIVKTFINHLKYGVLPRGEVFTIHVDKQLKEVVSMFHLLYYANNFETFLKTACWMRVHMNEGMFVYALTVAVKHREDCEEIILPPPYEIYPFYFVRSDVIQKAYLLKMKQGLLDPTLCEFYGIKKTEKGIYVIDENVYDHRVHLNEDDQLRYFTEDIDLNTYYYHFHVDYPFWMNDQIFKSQTRRFELTTYIYQQILARYYMERLSNGLGDIKTLSWYKPVTKGFWPWLQHHNGLEIPMRANNFVMVNEDNIDEIRLVEDYEMIIKEAILKGYVEVNGVRLQITSPKDIETLGRLIYGKVENAELSQNRVDAYRYLLIVIKSVLGLNTMTSDKYFVAPSILDQYQTALRDPVFYQLQKRLIDLVTLFKRRLPSYTKDDLIFPGVKIENVVVDKLVTYFDDSHVDITNAVRLTEAEIQKESSDMAVFARKRRLNHQPFTVTLQVASDKTVVSVVRIFLGPKKDHMGDIIDINTNRLNFVEIDTFVHKLTNGVNTIVRNSVDMHNLVQDRIMTHDLLKNIESGVTLKEIVIKGLKNYHTGFPSRLLLPRGRTGGLEMVLYCIVTPAKNVENVETSSVSTIDMWTTSHHDISMTHDDMPFGFPLDRHIDSAKFYTPNMKFVDVVIFHKNQVCDMQTRWNQWVLKNYNMVDKTMDVDAYFVDAGFEINRHI